MSPAQYADLLRVIALAGKNNQLASAMQLPIDTVFTHD
jgi:alkylhydroperoxidase family enzyme